MKRIQLSENFYLDEFLVSETAARHGIVMEVEEDSDVFNNLKRLCVEVLQPMRDELGPVIITSGFRTPLVNKLIGSSNRSNHPHGLCADTRVIGYTPYEVCQWIKANLDRLPIDQCINEFGQWTHLGMKVPSQKPRKQLLTAYKKRVSPSSKKTKTVYINGIHSVTKLELEGSSNG